MNKNTFSRFAAGLAVASVLSFFAGCGDSSTSADDSGISNLPESSPSVSDPAGNEGTPSEDNGEGGNVSDPSIEVHSSSSVVNPDAPVSNGGIPVVGFAAARTLSVTADTNGFFDAADIYKAAPNDYKLVYVIRHSERLSGLGSESPLTLGGAEQAEKMGASFGTGEKFFYASTNFIRTQETCLHFAKGHGDEGVTVEKWDRLDGSYFLTVSSDSLDSFAKKKGGSWKVIAAYAFGEDYYADQIAPLFYPLKERGNQFVMENILPNVPSDYRVSVLASHDVLMEPLVVYASEGTADINFYTDKKWVNYLSGVAIVVNNSSEVELYPVRGYDIGYMTLLKPSESSAKDSTAAPLLGSY